MIQQSIQVKQNDGTRVVVYAEISGDFAVHTSLNAPVDLFTVTHVPTMCCVRPRMTRAQADDLVKRLLTTGIDWSFQDPSKAADYGDVVIPIVRSVLAENPKPTQ